MAWNTDENGTKRFTSPEAPGWEVVEWAHSPGRVYVHTPGSATEVIVDDDGVTVFGESSNGYSFSGVQFTIPWSIVREIVRFQDAVQSR